MSVTIQVQPERQDVPAAITGSDCVPMIFGFAFGTATVEAAQRDSGEQDGYTRKPISKIRTVSMHYYYLLIAGAWCVEVTGE